jgi:PAS domain S-box-containing protein
MSQPVSRHTSQRLARVPAPKERRTASESSELPYRHLHDQAPDMWLCLDPANCTVLDSNRAVRDTLGYAREEIAGRSILILAHPESLESSRMVWEALGRCADLRDADIQVRRKDGTKLDISASASAILDNRGHLAYGVTVWRNISRRKRAEVAGLERQAQLRALAYEISVAEERERRRIAEGLHDEIGQALAIAKLKLGELGQSPSEPASPGLIEELRLLLDQAARATRSMTFELSPHILHQLGLEAAVEGLGKRLERVYGLRFRCERDAKPIALPEEVLVVLFRVVRELLLNVHKHAQARNALAAVHRVANEVVVRVEDDGVGFDPGKLSPAFTPRGGFGLFSAAAQIQALGGHLEVDTSHRPGSRIVISVPLPASALIERSQP